MKDLRVTGLAQETDFDGDDGDVQYLLVLNKGQLRIPISGEAAQSVLQFLYAGASNGSKRAVEEEHEEGEGEEESSESETTDEDGVDQI